MAKDKHKMKLPARILVNVRAAEDKGHRLYSQGCGMFRCRGCNVTGYLDDDTRPPSSVADGNAGKFAQACTKPVQVDSQYH